MFSFQILYEQITMYATPLYDADYETPTGKVEFFKYPSTPIIITVYWNNNIIERITFSKENR